MDRLTRWSGRGAGALCGVAAVLTGCAGGGSRVARESPAETEPARAEAPAGDAESFYRSREAERLVGDLMDGAALDQAHASNGASFDSVPVRTEPPVTNLSAAYDVGSPATAEGTELEGSKPASIVAPGGASEGEFSAVEAMRSPEEIQAALVADLATALRSRADGPEWPIPALIRLAALDLLEPGVFNSYYLAGAREGALSTLHPRDVELLGAWRDLFRRTREALSSDRENADLALIAQEFADTLEGQQSLRIPRAVLCSRVEGFGLYEEFPLHDGRYKLLAGRRHRMIVYAELERFAHRSETRDGVSGFSVELTEDLALYHAGGARSTLAWRKPNQQISDFSRNRRRDFFIVQIVDLPETLTIGSYDLKIRVLDEGSEPSSQAEYIIPIDVVADVSAFTSGE